MALQDLLTHILVSQADGPEAYRRVRLNEAYLRSWLSDRPGWRLLSGRGIYRLQRLPSRVVLERGLPGLRTPMDYACLCWVLWFAENRSSSSRDWFVISELAGEVTRVADGSFDLGERTHREALVRALQLLEDLMVLRNRDGDANLWAVGMSADRERTEVLYDFAEDAPRLLANFNRHGLDRLSAAVTGDRLLPPTGEEAQPLVRAWRAILLGPGLWRSDDPEAFVELRVQAARVQEELEAALGWGLEIGRDYARIWRETTARSGMGTLLDLAPEPGEEGQERHLRFIFQPIVLLMTSVRADIQAGRLAAAEDGTVETSGSYLRGLLLDLHRLFRRNWGVELGERTKAAELSAVVFSKMREIGYLRGPDELDRIWILPAAAFVAAEYVPEPSRASASARPEVGGSRRQATSAEPDLFGTGEHPA